MHQLVLAGERQADPRLSPIGEAETPEPTALLPGRPGGGKHVHPQQQVQQLALDIAVLAEDQDAGKAVHNLLEVLLFLRWEGDAAQLACSGKGRAGKEKAVQRDSEDGQTETQPGWQDPTKAISRKLLAGQETRKTSLLEKVPQISNRNPFPGLSPEVSIPRKAAGT